MEILTRDKERNCLYLDRFSAITSLRYTLFHITIHSRSSESNDWSDGIRETNQKPYFCISGSSTGWNIFIYLEMNIKQTTSHPKKTLPYPIAHTHRSGGFQQNGNLIKISCKSRFNPYCAYVSNDALDVCV